ASLLGLINPIVNKPECSNADCHAHPPEQTILGVLDVKMSMAGADADRAEITNSIIAAAIVTTLVLGLFSAAFINLVVRRPVRQLIRGIEKVAGGDLEAEIEVVDRNELGQLARAFNEMTRDLRRAREENLLWSHTLEQKIVDKTEELSRTQRQVDHMEKMASLGKLAATVAHELNNPLSGIWSYARPVARDVEEGDGSPHQVKEDARYL
ncbi:MAG: HAMP domain-containing protein, partial [bacterium]|nr:HAMP domain-containing protein [bacterium]